MVLFTSGHKPNLGRRWGREHGRIGADVRLLYGKRKMKGREVNVLKRREAGEITQSLIFRNRKRAKGSKPGKKGGSQECKAVEAEDLDPLSPPPPPCSPPLTLDSISHFESAHVLCQIALRDCFGGRSLTQFLVHPCNREVKSLSQVVKVANFLDLNKSWSCKHGRGKKEKIDAYDSCAWFQSGKRHPILFFHRSTMKKQPSPSRKIFEIQKSCYHGNLTSHFSSL